MLSGEMMLNFRDQAMQLLIYEPETGLFRWRVRRNGRGGGVRPGDVAGTPSPYGYVQIKVAGRAWLAHRLAFLFVTGSVPANRKEVDHINGCRTDNRWTNLREVTRSQNNWNFGLSRRNVSGVKGVSWNAATGKWMARLSVDGRIVHLGYHDTVEAAATARRAGERQYHGEFARAA